MYVYVSVWSYMARHMQPSVDVHAAVYAHICVCVRSLQKHGKDWCNIILGRTWLYQDQVSQFAFHEYSKQVQWVSKAKRVSRRTLRARVTFESQPPKSAKSGSRYSFITLNRIISQGKLRLSHCVCAYMCVCISLCLHGVCMAHQHGLVYQNETATH